MVKLSRQGTDITGVCYVERTQFERPDAFFPAVREDQGLLQIAEEADHRLVDLLCPLLLGPVAATRQYDGSLQLRNKVHEIGDQPVHAGKGNHQVAVAGDIECGYQDPRSGEWRQKLPVAVDVAVPVETAAKPGAGKFLDIKMKVGFGEPSRQSRDRLHSGEEAALPRDHPDGAGRRRRLSRDRAEDGAHRMADI